MKSIRKANILEIFLKRVIIIIIIDFFFYGRSIKMINNFLDEMKMFSSFFFKFLLLNLTYFNECYFNKPVYLFYETVIFLERLLSIINCNKNSAVKFLRHLEILEFEFEAESSKQSPLFTKITFLFLWPLQVSDFQNILWKFQNTLQS